MHNLTDMHEQCKQCKFMYARIDTEGWGNSSARRVMCPVCGWTLLNEHTWKDGQPQLVQSCESRGFGAYRLVPPCGFSGYNAFHSLPDAEVVAQIKELLNVKGWKGYLTLWDETIGHARLVAGSPLQKLNVVAKLGPN
jgi:rubredoxin